MWEGGETGALCIIDSTVHRSLPYGLPTSEMSASVASHSAEMELMLLTRCAKKAEG